MNEFETDLEKPYKPSKEWLACSARAVETENFHEPENGIAAVIAPAGNSRHTVERNRPGQSIDGHTIPPGNTRTGMLAGFGAGALLGFLVASRRNGKHV